MFHIPIEDLTESDIQQLADNHTLESQYLDFKEVLPNLQIDKSKSAMCGDIAAFANASGGDLIYGVSEEESDTQDVMCALGIPGVDVRDADELIRQITEIVERGIEPLGLAVRVRVIGFEDGRRVVVVRVPESFRKPLRVIGTSYWYIRVNNKNSHMQYNQIQDFFLNSDRLAERVRAFREERIAAILSNDSIAPFCSDRLIVYHFIPMPAYDREFSADLSIYQSRVASMPVCINDGAGYVRSTIDGFAHFGYFKGGLESISSKTEVFRSGAIEMVDSLTLHDVGESISFEYTANKIRHAISQAIIEFPKLRLQGKVVFFLSMLNVGGLSISGFAGNRIIQNTRVSRRSLHFPEFVLEANSPDLQVIEDTLDLLASAFGFSHPRNASQ